MLKKLIILSQFVFLLSTPVTAGVTGKISGRITDSQNDEGLPGVNVIVDGTFLGAATDNKGYYTILHVPPGTHILKASLIGYTNITVSNVIVAIEQTTSINVDMDSEVLGLNEVTIMAERPLVIKDVSNSQLNISASTIETIPVLDVTEVIGLQAGVRGLSIRGGSSSQTTFILDGIVLNDERSNVPYTAVSLGSINEVQIQLGGFNAEYGNARSGVINVITKDGNKERYSGSFILNYQPAGAKQFGPSIYDPNTYFTRPYMDPEVSFVGTENGPWDAYTRRQYPRFEGWNAISAATLMDSDPSNDLTPEGAKRLYEWQHRRDGNITEPDYTLDLSIGGPVPLMEKKLGTPTFYASFREVREMFIFPLSRDNYKENSARLKIITEPNRDSKLLLTASYGETRSVSQYNWITTPTGSVLRSSFGIANLINSSSGNSIIYMPGWYSPSTIYRNIFGIKYDRVINSNTYYEIKVQHNINRYNTFKIADRDTSDESKTEIYPGLFVDEAPYGYRGDGEGSTAIDGMGIGGWMNLGRDRSVNSTTSLRFDLSGQLNHYNQYKTGINFVFNDYDIKSFTRNPGKDTWNRDQVYRVNPYRMSAYLQDKLEFEGFIANIGGRFDLSNANSDRYVLDDFDNFYKEGQGDLLEEEAPTENTKTQWSISPRLGISHPISENSKLYFNYGHFRQEPSSTFRFRIQREYSGLVTSIGEPDLNFEKTVSYELGYSHSIYDEYLLNLSAYYKDITNQKGWIYFQNINNTVQYLKAANNNYADIRGFEVTLDKRLGTWLTGFVNYTYMVQTSGFFGVTSNFQDTKLQSEFLISNPKQSRPSPRPYMRANFDIHTPKNWGRELFGMYPTGGWNVNLLGTWEAGALSTYNPSRKTGIVNNVQWKDTYNIDVRITKFAEIRNYYFQFFIDITNLLNTKFLSTAGFSDNFDNVAYLESLHFSWEEGIEKGNDRLGEYREEGVEFVPMLSVPNFEELENRSQSVLYYDQSTEKYMQFTDEGWLEQDISSVKRDVLDRKAYIDMPNFTYFTFFNPRKISFGLKVSF